jgi:hypothetical protein
LLPTYHFRVLLKPNFIILGHFSAFSYSQNIAFDFIDTKKNKVENVKVEEKIPYFLSWNLESAGICGRSVGAPLA